MTTPPSIVVGRVLVCGLGNSGKAELSRLLRDATDAWREVGGPILLWANIAPLATLPIDEAKAVVLRTTSSLFGSCEHITLILPGMDVPQTLLRTALRGLAITTGAKTPRVRVMESFAPAMQAARDAGLLTVELERAVEAVGARSQDEKSSPSTSA